MRRFAAACLGVLAVPSLPPGGEEGKAKIYILAGQSNMEGKAQVKLLERQIDQPGTADLFRHLRKDGRWVERDDVWIKFLDRRGRLTVGFGSPGCIGPELEFGNVVGDFHPEPVLLIKTAWGGRSLYQDFRPPRSGLPPPEVLERLLEGLRKKKPGATLEDVKEMFGRSYRAMLEEVRGVLGDLGTYLPPYKGQGFELAGFVWFQGWNDMISDTYTAEYAGHLANFIRDVRRDLGVPGLPFVIGQMGVDGAEAGPKIQRFKAAQAEAAALPEFRGNVELVRTDVFWDTEAHAVFKKGWKEHPEEWNAVGSNAPYHYLGSVKTMCRIGRAFGEAVLRLRGAAR